MQREQLSNALRRYEQRRAGWRHAVDRMSALAAVLATDLKEDATRQPTREEVLNLSELALSLAAQLQASIGFTDELLQVAQTLAAAHDMQARDADDPPLQ